MNYLYHIAHKNLKGKYLMPLNELKKIYPDIYKKQAKKYEWRKDVMKIKISPLNCLWNDVLHMTAIHPKKIKSAFMKSGADYFEFKRWFKIDPKLLDKDNAVIDFGKEGYILFEPKELKKYNKVSKRTSDYYKEKLDKRENVLLFSKTNPILYKGKLKIADLEIIEI